MLTKVCCTYMLTYEIHARSERIASNKLFFHVFKMAAIRYSDIRNLLPAFSLPKFVVIVFWEWVRVYRGKQWSIPYDVIGTHQTHRLLEHCIEVSSNKL